MLYSFGHSNHSIDTFKQLTRPLAVIIDVRSHPSSRLAYFRREQLQLLLGSRYEWEPRLGGWSERYQDEQLFSKELQQLVASYGVQVAAYTGGYFPKQIIAATLPARSPSWTNRGLYDYSWCTVLPEWQVAVDQLIERSQYQDIGIFCAESLWFKCHRSMVSDYVCYRGFDVCHLAPYLTKSQGLKTSAKWHSLALGDRLERYEPVIRAHWR